MIRPKGTNGQHVWRTEPDIVTEKELPVPAYYTGKEIGEWDWFSWYLDINTVSTAHGHLRTKEIPVLTSIIITQRKKYQFWHMYNNYAEKEMPVLTYREKEMPVLTYREKEMPVLTYREKEMPVLTYREKEMPVLTYREKEMPVLTCYHRERVGHLLTSFSTLWWTGLVRQLGLLVGLPNLIYSRECLVICMPMTGNSHGLVEKENTSSAPPPPPIMIWTLFLFRQQCHLCFRLIKIKP